MFKVTEETDKHFKLKHPSGHEVKIAKKGLSKEMVSKIQGYAQGGKVAENYGVSPENTLDEEKTDKFKQSFSGQKQENPKLQQSIAKQNPPAPQNLYEGGVSQADEFGDSVVQDPTAEFSPQPQNIPTGEVASTPTASPAPVQTTDNNTSNPEPSGWDMIKGAGSAIADKAKSVYNTVNSTQLGHSLLTGTMNEAAPVQPQQPQTTPANFTPETQQPTGPENVPLGQSQQQPQQFQMSSQPKAANPEQEQQQNVVQNAQTIFKDMHQEYMDTAAAVRNSPHDANRYFHNMDTGQKLSTAIGLILGGLGGAAGQPNVVLDFVNKQIDRDIESQKMEMGKNTTLLEANMRHYGNLKDAMEATNIMQKAAFEGLLGKAAMNSLNNPLARAQYQNTLTKLQLDTAQLGQTFALRQAALRGGGMSNPAMGVRFLVPEKQQDMAFKELKEMQGMQKIGTNALNSFDKVSNMTLGGALSPKQRNAEIAPVLAQMVKESEGRITPQDVPMIGALFPSATDGPGTRQLKRQKLSQFLKEKMNSPILDAYGIQKPQISEAQKIASGPHFQQIGFKK